MINVLLTGVGGPTPLGIAKSLLDAYGEKISMVGVDADPLAAGLYNTSLFKNTYRVPLVTENGYWDKIRSIVEKESIDFAFVVPETEVIEWARYKEKHSLPCNSLIPDFEMSELMYDKFRVSEELKGKGLTPPTLELNESNARKTGTELGYPYWVRVRAGAGAIGSYKIESYEDIENWLKVNPPDSKFIASPYLPGRNYACKMLFHNDRLVMSASGERVGYLMSSAAPSGISGMSSHGRLINNSELTDRSRSALEFLFQEKNKPIHGMFTVDFKESHDGTPYITEINIRHVSFTHAFSLAGANFAEKTVDVFHLGKEFQTDSVHFNKNFRFIRGVDSPLFIIEESSKM